MLRDGYDFSNDAISRLAEQDAPRRWIVLTGIAIVSLASILLGVLVGRRWDAKVAAVLMVIAGSSALALGIFPCSPGCPGIDAGFTDRMHSSAAAVHYITFGLSPLVLAVDSRGFTPGAFKALSIFATVFGGAFLFSQFTGWGPNGITQRVGLTTLDIWMVTTAVLLIRTHSREERGPLTPLA
jgi:hypothetical membrane protein